MYSELFERIGLNKNESLTLNYLIKNGTSPVSNIVKGIELNKGLIYIALENLVKLKLVSEDKNSKVSTFSPENPYKLLDFMNNKENEIKKTKNDLESNISKIMSDFNLISNKPGVMFFEGEEGIRTVLFDNLNTKEIIYGYGDAEMIIRNFGKLNDEYTKQRDKLKIKKRVIISDTKYARNIFTDYHTSTTEIRFADTKTSFGSFMQIYDNKVSYVVYNENIKIGIIINDKNIYNMHRVLFENNWINLKQLTKK